MVKHQLRLGDCTRRSDNLAAIVVLGRQTDTQLFLVSNDISLPMQGAQTFSLFSLWGSDFTEPQREENYKSEDAGRVVVTGNAAQTVISHGGIGIPAIDVTINE